MENLHLTLIPEEILEQVQRLVDEANDLLRPYMIALTPEERHTMAKMGEKTLAFVEKAHDFAKHEPNLSPAYLDMQAFDIDFADARNLWTLLVTIQQLYDNVNDTQMVAGSESYQSALMFYNSVKMAARQDIPGAKAVYNELRTRFPGGRRKSSETVTETFTETIKKEVSES